MAAQSLEDVLAGKNPVDVVRHSQIGPYVYPVVPLEFTNWRDEQMAWRKTCVLFNQTHHMMDLYLEGPDALELLTDLGVNSFKNFAVNKAKQIVVCNYDGFVIGDAILFYLAENTFNIVGRPSAQNWIQFHCETGGYDAKVQRDERSAAQQGPPRRRVYRYQVQGPNAAKLMAKVTGGPMPEIKFFNMDTITIAGKAVRALRHGMAGQPGWELFGPWEDDQAVREAIVAAGGEFGLRQVGSRAYATNTLESGWIPCPMPAIFSGEKMKSFRQWLPAKGYEATGSLGGSYYSDNIEDYYLTPYALGYGSIVKFDHDFIGREALEKMAGTPQRKRVTLAWNGEDVARVFQSAFTPGAKAAKFIELPLSNYSSWPNDKVVKDGQMVGVSTFSGYSYNEQTMLSLAMLDAEHSEPGTQVTLVWGEEGGGSSKPVVEPHVQAQIRATVGPVPYGEAARTTYRP